MLVLSRRVGEEIVVEGGIRITILDVQKGQVRVGITAPHGVRIDRQEIHERRRIFDECCLHAGQPAELN